VEVVRGVGVLFLVRDEVGSSMLVRYVFMVHTLVIPLW